MCLGVKNFVGDLGEWNLWWEEFDGIGVTLNSCLRDKALEASVMVHAGGNIPCINTMDNLGYSYVWFDVDNGSSS